MSCRLTPSWSLLLILSMFAAESDATGQQNHSSSRGPRFLLAAWTGGSVRDASGAAVLRRRVSLELREATIGEALKEVTKQADLEISYSPSVVPIDRTVSLHARSITVAAALTEILLDVAVDVSVTLAGGLGLVPRPLVASVPADSGAVVGQVTDSGSGAPITGATVSIEGTRRSAVTDAGGRFRIGGLAPGTYSVRARFIGYTALASSVVVSANRETTVDFPLEKSVQPLEQLVVTGTIVPTEVKALPTPVSIINESDITLQRPRTVQEIFRQMVPGASSWDQASNPYQTLLSVRGASTLVAGGGQMKVFIDGIEAASHNLAAVDPNSIERIEVIRGPQAAAIYGSDAIGGVVQVLTKRGDPLRTQTQLEAEAAMSLMQTPYSGYGGVIRQGYKASVRGGAQDLSYDFGAGYSHTADYLPDGEQSAQSNPSVYGGMRYTHGIMTADLSGRYYTQNVPAVGTPELAQSGFAFWSKPFYQSQQWVNQTVGARLAVAPRSWWQHSLTLGIDRVTQDLEQSQPRRTTPADTLLSIINQSYTKTSISYNTSARAPLTSDLSGSLTLGFDHWSLPNVFLAAQGALTTTGTIQTAPGRPIFARRDVTTNTGYFVQAQAGVHDALFLTAGIRAEENTNFGTDLATPVSPRVGLSYAQQMGSTTLKLRGAYGRAVRPPQPGQRFAAVGSLSTQLANEELGPERQRGWDAGIDAVFGSRGSMSVTYYNQIADGLIQSVQVQATPVPTSQFQNVGRVRNTGIEFEGTLSLGLVALKGQYGYTRSRIVQLAPSYAGELRVGDQSLLTPKHTAGGSLIVTPSGRTTIGTGLTYVGSWQATDWVAVYRCLGATGPCQAGSPAGSNRNYIITYPSFIKVKLSISQRITRLLAAFLSVDNVTNNKAYERFNLIPVVGRISTVGIRLSH